MEAQFSGTTVVVTGGGQGIGAAVSRAFAQHGARTVVHYRSGKEAADIVVADIVSSGGEALAVQASLDIEAEVEQLFRRATDAFGTIGVLVNNAGSFPNCSVLDMSLDDWRKMYADNMESTFLCTRNAGQLMKESGGGAIVNIASISAAIPGPDHSHYNSAKAAVVMFTRSAAQELGRYNIRVNAVSPGVVDREGITDAWPDGVKRFIDAAPLSCLVQAEDVANACVFLASDKAARITGADLPVDSGVLSAQIY